MNQNNINSQGNNGIINNQVANDAIVQSTQINKTNIGQQMMNQVNNVYQYEPNNISLDNNDTNKDNMINKKKILKIILVVILLLVIISVGLLMFSMFNKSNVSDELDNNELVLQDKLWNDYKDGVLTTDEYVRYMLYSEYDSYLLDEEYKKLKSSDSTSLEELVNGYLDELSDETLKYYFKKINLDGVTFELDKENNDIDENKLALSNLFIDKVYAADKVTNLNKVVLSEEGNFVVWYTTTGDSASSYMDAKKVADGLENTLVEYTKLFGRKYHLSANIISKGKKYKSQKKVLESFGIDSSYLENAMQVYLIEYTNDSMARYIGRIGSLVELSYNFSGGDENGSIIFPYIIIKPSSFDNYERLAQLYNHELFHHYQHEILCGHSKCEVGEDPYILDATANWASALVTEKTNNSGFLNEWAGTALSFSDSLLSDEILERYGKNRMSYALFVYLYNYANVVENGTHKIISSIYKDDSLKYLNENATIEELSDIQENVIVNRLKGYDNKNLDACCSTPPNEVSISHENYGYQTYNKYDNVNLSPLAHNYYAIFDASERAYEITINRSRANDVYVSVTILKLNGGKWELVDSSKKTAKSHTFNTNDYGKYDQLLVVVSNIDMKTNNEYTLIIKEIQKKQQLEDMNYFSIGGCGYNDGVEKGIETYYFDDNGKVSRIIYTITWYEEIEAIGNYEVTMENPNFINVKITGRVVTSELSKEEVQKRSYLTKDGIVANNDMECGGKIVDFTPDID